MIDNSRTRSLSFWMAWLVPMPLIAALAAILAISLESAHWVDDSSLFYWGILLGFLCGVLLAASRFRGLTALAYSAFVSTAMICQLIGRVAPSLQELGSLQIWNALWLMHLRLLTLSDRMMGWAVSLMQGQSVQDTGLFVLLMGLLVWNASTWLVWAVVRRHDALAGLLPYGLLLALDVQLRGQALEGLWLSIPGGLLLMAFSSYVREHADWEERKVDYPEYMAGAWLLSSIGLVIGISLLAGAAPWVGTPEGWRALSDFFHPVQQQMANTSDRLFAAVNPAPYRAPAVSIAAPDLNRIGSPLPSGDDTVMWVSTSDPPPAPPQAQPNLTAGPGPQHYWASASYGDYTGSGWVASGQAGFNASVGLTSFIGRYRLEQHFKIMASHGDTLFAANLPITASQSALIRFDRAGDSALVRGATSEYDVTSWVMHPGGLEVARLSNQYPAEITLTYLQLPPSLPQRVRVLASRIVSGSANAYEKAIRIQNYLRITYPYKIDTPAPPAGRDAVDYFLFDAPGGFCTYYASAMAVLLRAESVPARVVTGYAMGQYDRAQKAYRVPVSAAHAWVQAYLPGYEWVEFEPTPSEPAIEYLAAHEEAVAPSTPQRGDAGNGDIFNQAWLVFAALIGCLAITAWLYRQVEWLRGTDKGRAKIVYSDIRRSLAWVGLDAPSSLTPDEFVARHARVLADRDILSQAIERATGLYVRATFSPDAPSKTETEAARRMWQRARSQWLGLGVTRIVGLVRRGIWFL